MVSVRKQFHGKRRFVAVILALLMAFSFVPRTLIKAFAAAPASYTTITADTTATVHITSPGSAQYFRFDPVHSGTYEFYSSDHTSDPYGALLDANGSELVRNDDGRGSLNFSITYDCTAGETYYIKAYLYSSSTTGSYTLHVDTLSVECTHDYVLQNAIPASCMSDGVETYICSLCNDTYETVTAALNHDYVNGVCTRCGDVNYAAVSCVEINAAGGTNYSLFNSGLNTSSESSRDGNYDESSFTNNGYDLTSNNASYSPTSQYRMRLGLSFHMHIDTEELSTVTIYAYDIDENGGATYTYRFIESLEEGRYDSVNSSDILERNVIINGIRLAYDSAYTTEGGNHAGGTSR